MSHSVVMINVGPMTDPNPRAIEDRVADLLAPYDENTRVEPYKDWLTAMDKGQKVHIHLMKDRLPTRIEEPVEPETPRDFRARWMADTPYVPIPDDEWRAVVDRWDAFVTARDRAYAAAYTDEEVVTAYNLAYYPEGTDEDSDKLFLGTPEETTAAKAETSIYTISTYNRPGSYICEVLLETDEPGEEWAPNGRCVHQDMDELPPFTRHRPLGGAKWDWYQIGGRWSGFWTVRDGAAAAVSGKVGTGEHMEIRDEARERLASIGVPAPAKSDIWGSVTAGPETPLGAMTATIEAERAAAKVATRQADWARKGDIDFEGMRAQAGVDAGKWWDECGSDMALSWEEPGLTPRTISRDDYIEKIVREWVPGTFAILDPTEGWFERGHMGWWGAVSGEQPLDEWHARWRAYLDSLPDDHVLVATDVHI